MRLGTARLDGGAPRVVARTLHGTLTIDVASAAEELGLLGERSPVGLLGYLRQGAGPLFADLRAAVLAHPDLAGSGWAYPPDQVELLAPLPRPPRVLFADAAAALTITEPASVLGPNGSLSVSAAEAMRLAGRLGIVIGPTGTAAAMPAIAGLTLVLAARDGCAMGPWLTPAGDIKRALADLRLRTTISPPPPGARADESTGSATVLAEAPLADAAGSLEEIVAAASRETPLLAGDILVLPALGTRADSAGGPVPPIDAGELRLSLDGEELSELTIRLLLTG